jgi:hypothetical protein
VQEMPAYELILLALKTVTVIFEIVVRLVVA